MNYFAHAFRFLDGPPRPAFLAGLAVPDWLNVVDRKAKTRSKSALAFLNAEPRGADEAAIAKGIIQHHQDDHWFHDSPAFVSLSLQFAVELRDLLAPDPGFRPSFLGHILIELLLDDYLIGRDPNRIEAYYKQLATLDTTRVEQTVSRIANRPVTGLHWFIGRFLEVRFLYDYADDEKLLTRLNQVMQRVKLLPLPDRLVGFLKLARTRVAEQADQLYFGPLRQSSNPTRLEDAKLSD